MHEESFAPPVKPPPRKGEQTRMRIVRAAGELFAEQGVAQVRVDDIAHATGLSIGAIYKYFPNKYGILLEFVSEGMGLLETYHAEARSAPSALDRVTFAGDAYLRFVHERPAVVRFMMVRAMQPDPSPDLAEVNAAISARLQKLVLETATDLKQAMVDDEIVTVPLDELMVILWSMWEGLTKLLARKDGAAITYELSLRAIDRFRDILLRSNEHARIHPDRLYPQRELS